MRGIELFAGCGGLALGMARGGIKHDLVIECDQQTAETLKENKLAGVEHVRHWNLNTGYTQDVDFSQFAKTDLISGGPPCQPFSISGKHLGQNDLRNMWPEAIRSVREARPKAFVFENVRGFLRPAFKRYLEYVVLQLSHPSLVQRRGERWDTHLGRLRRHAETNKSHQSDYRVIAKAVNAADYGAAQKRHRAIIMGVRKDITENWQFPLPTHSQEALVWAKYISKSYWKRHDVRVIGALSSTSERAVIEMLRDTQKKPALLPWVTARDVLADLPPPQKKSELQGHWQHPGARTYQNHSGSVLDEPAKALKAGDHGVPGGENMLVNRLGNARYFTVREMARLQGIPDDFVITGSWKAATRQLGNAVPTQIGEVFARHVGKILRAARK